MRTVRLRRPSALLVPLVAVAFGVAACGADAPEVSSAAVEPTSASATETSTELMSQDLA